MKWNHTKLGNWFWRNYWYKVSWTIGDLKFKYTILWLLKNSWFTEKEIGLNRIKHAKDIRLKRHF